jgi:protein-S-isoprenylcysteine O-methyltransferase Ste14
MARERSITEHGPDVIAPPPLVYLIPLVAGLLLDRKVPLPHLPRAARLAGLPLLAGGAGLIAWFVSSMVGARTPIDVREAPTALVEAGPFAYTRNPAYLSMALVYTGISLLAGGRWSLLFLPGALLAVDRGVIRREEPYLERRFGRRYRDYRSRVRRWV